MEALCKVDLDISNGPSDVRQRYASDRDLHRANLVEFAHPLRAAVGLVTSARARIASFTISGSSSGFNSLPLGVTIGTRPTDADVASISRRSDSVAEL